MTNLTVAQIAHRQQVRTETVLRWIHRGYEDPFRKLKATKLLGSRGYRILEADLDAFLEPVPV